MKPDSTGTLYIVPTPIGNMEDMTFRALKVIEEVDILLCEDTRKTKALLSHYKLKAKVKSLHSYNESRMIGKIATLLKEGKSAAIVSESGTPCISDPGSILVRELLSRKIRVSPLPGPSALSAALSMSGASGKIVFIGFLPKNKGKRQRELEWIRSVNEHVMVYESPKRMIKLLQELKSILPDRKIMAIKEISKIYETYFLGRASEILKELSCENLRGEFVIHIFKGDRERLSDKEIRSIAMEIMQQDGISQNECARKISKGHKLPKSLVYDIIQRARDEKTDK